MSSAVKNYEGLINNLANLQIRTGKIVISKILVTGPNVDAFMKGFKCAECGGCCGKLDCMVVDLDDIKNLAPVLKVSTLEFQRLYCFYHEKIYLKFPCPFYKDNQCIIYDKVRPKVCRLYPCNATLCTDGNYYIGVKETCKAGVEYLRKFEEEMLAKVPVVAEA
jgi:Fe-S-cluster containining protein